MLGRISWEQGKGDAPVVGLREKQDVAASAENPGFSEPVVTVLQALSFGYQVQSYICADVAKSPRLLKHG